MFNPKNPGFSSFPLGSLSRDTCMPSLPCALGLAPRHLKKVDKGWNGDSRNSATRAWPDWWDSARVKVYRVQGRKCS